MSLQTTCLVSLSQRKSGFLTVGNEQGNQGGISGGGGGERALAGRLHGWLGAGLELELCSQHLNMVLLVTIARLLV